MMEVMAPGFRFYPTEEELVSFYLHNKLERRREDLNRVMDRVIPVLDIYEFNPRDLPQFSGDFCREDPEQWFFFIPRQESEYRGGRPKRLTTSGYWKATGSPGYVYSFNNCSIGVKRTMVFYKGRAPNGRKTEWKMNEYKAIEGQTCSSSAHPTIRQEFSLCRVYKKSKCLRAFDRRPVGVEIGQLRTQNTHSDEVIATHQNPALTMERTRSQESSSSGDHGQPFQTGETSNMTMTIDNEPLWDWEELDPYYNGEGHAAQIL